MATVCELNLRAPPDLVILELSDCNIIGVNGVDANSVEVGDYDIEARRVEGHGLDRILELLHDLEGEGTWVSCIAPDHQGLVGGCRRQDWLFHAGGYSRNFLSVERNSQI